MPVINADNSVQVVADKVSDLTAKTGIAGALNGAQIDLFENNITPTPNSVIGDFTIPTYVGYAADNVAAWTTVDPQTDGSASTNSNNVMSFTGPAAGSGPTIYGYLIRKSAGPNALIAAVKFTTPFPLNDNTDILNLVATYRVP